jgi:hypothetical protein
MFIEMNGVGHSIAPAIFGAEDIKRALACQLFGGARKVIHSSNTSQPFHPFINHMIMIMIMI